MLPRDWEVGGTTDAAPALPANHPLWDAMIPRKTTTVEFPLDSIPPETLNLLMGHPSLWDKKPDAVVHVAGACLVLFNRFMRQRCDWCGTILLEYDLQRLAVPVGQESLPANWPPGFLVQVDGNMSAAIDNPETVNGDIQLPPNSCAYDPETQIHHQCRRTDPHDPHVWYQRLLNGKPGILPGTQQAPERKRHCLGHG